MNRSSNDSALSDMPETANGFFRVRALRNATKLAVVGISAYAIAGAPTQLSAAGDPPTSAAASVLNAVPQSTNLLLNGGFERGDYSRDGSPNFWMRAAWNSSTAQFTWDERHAYQGNRSVRIDTPTANDARWIQSVAVLPNTLYELTGWIKTKDVAWKQNEGEGGANLSVMADDLGWYQHTEGLFGRNDWTRASILFNSREESQVEIDARLGFFSGTTTGTAWFDGLRVREVGYSDPHPRWRILVLIYGRTDFAFTDAEGIEHHFVARMTDDEKAAAEAAARRFVRTDIPALTSQNMIPRLDVRYPQEPLSELTAIGNGWWPDPKSTRRDRDPAFDSIIAIWDETGEDAVTGEQLYLGGGYGGLTPNMGTGQTYSAITVDMATAYGAYNSTNVFKHEWGHSILDFYEAAGVAPRPTVDNHIGEGMYVHCNTGEGYILLDESDDNPIPNSIYNDESGFTHDYYSGTTALPENPQRCLGITPDAWARGGPVTRPSS